MRKKTKAGGKDAESEFKRQVGARIKYFRLQQNLTQGQLSELAELGVNYLSEIERGHRSLRAKVLLRLSKALNVQVYQFYQTETGQSEDFISKSIARKRVLVLEGLIEKALTDTRDLKDEVKKLLKVLSTD